MPNQATTGLTEEQWEELAVLVAEEIPERRAAGRPVALGNAPRVRLTLEHLRNNEPQHALAEHYGVSQPTVCRVIKAILPLIDKALADYDRGLDDLGPHDSLIIDGTLVPTGRRGGIERLYNGKHKTHGVNVQVLSLLDGTPVWASPPMPGADHDLTCFRAHGLDHIFNARTGIADAGYQGHGTNGLTTPAKRKPGWELTDDRAEFNRDLAATRALIERVNAWLKAFKILTTRYRRNWNDLELTIRTVFRLLRFRYFTQRYGMSYE